VLTTIIALTSAIASNSAAHSAVRRNCVSPEEPFITVLPNMPFQDFLRATRLPRRAHSHNGPFVANIAQQCVYPGNPSSVTRVTAEEGLASRGFTFVTGAFTLALP